MEMVDARFAKWATSFSGCDGGDIGSPQSKSIWYCGIVALSGEAVIRLMNMS